MSSPQVASMQTHVPYIAPGHICSPQVALLAKPYAHPVARKHEINAPHATSCFPVFVLPHTATEEIQSVRGIPYGMKGQRLGCPFSDDQRDQIAPRFAAFKPQQAVISPCYQVGSSTTGRSAHVPLQLNAKSTRKW